MDPQTGMSRKAQIRQEQHRTAVRLQLQPGEAMIVQTASDAGASIAEWTYLDVPARPLALTNTWQLSFSNGGPFMPAARQLDKLQPWTALNDTAANAYCGSGTYTTRFTLPEKRAREYVLDLGQVQESAHVWVNGQDAGIYWAIPFKRQNGTVPAAR